MKRRFRHFLRNGWHIAEIPRTNLYKWDQLPYYEFDRNRLHYLEICQWCEQTFKPGTWESSCHSNNGTSKPGVKRFAFQQEKDKTMFILKWL